MTKKYRQPERRPLTSTQWLQPETPAAPASANGAEGFWQSEERYRSVVTAMTEGMVLQTADGTILDCNEQATRILGLSRNQILGKSSRDPSWRAVREDGSHFPGNEHPSMIALKTGRPCRQVVMGFQLPAGRRRWININAEPLYRVNDAKAHGVVVTFTDITERKLAVEGLRNSEEQYRALFANMQNGFAHCQMVFNRAGRAVDFIYLKVNPAFTRLTGLRNVAGRRVTEVIPGIRQMHPELFEIYGRVTRTGQPEQFEFEFKPLGLWLQIAVYRPQPGHFAAVFENITQRKLAEAVLRLSRDNLEQRVLARTAELNRLNLALQKSEERFRSIAAHTPDHIIIQDRKLRYQTVINPHVGLTEAQMIGKTERDLFRKKEADMLQAIKKKVLKTGQSMHMEMPFRNVLGKMDYFEGDYVPILDAAGKAVGLIGYFRNITDRKRLEQEILNISDWERRRLAADLHDGLGQILVGASYLTDSLKNQLDKPSGPAGQHLHRLQEVLQTAIHKVRKMARGVQPVPPEPNGLMVALQKLAEQTQTWFGVRCVFRCRSDITLNNPQTATHVFRMAQEAVTNAIKHGQAKRIAIRLTQNRRQITLVVTDNGLGLAAGQKQNTGMGLRIMRYRAGLIGGELTIKDNSAGGATVTCSVGLAAAGK